MSTATTALTPRQRAILEWIAEKTAEQGYPPTFRELMEHFGIRSPNGIACHIKPLRQKGYLRPATPGSARTLALAGTAASLSVTPNYCTLTLRLGGAVLAELAPSEALALADELRRVAGEVSA